MRGDANACDVYAWSIRHALAPIPVPLKAPDPDLHLSLADVVALAYERGRYDLTIDYQRPLDLPLQPEDKAWAVQLTTGSLREMSS